VEPRHELPHPCRHRIGVEDAIADAAVVWPLAARAQQATGRPLIGILSPLSRAAAARNIGALGAGLRELERRDFITLISGSAVGWPLAARAALR
jgi:hypothetical protein